MAKRGGCKHCVWLSCGSKCASGIAAKITPHGHLKPLFNETVKSIEERWNGSRWEQHEEYDGCFKYTTPGGGAKGVSDFLRRRQHADRL